MTWYKDLTECDYFGKEYAQNLRAIGWLEGGKLFPVGEINIMVLQKIIELRKNPWTLGRTMFRGYHSCDICKLESELEEGTINLFIPAEGFLYVCPELIIHYIKEHKYIPPNEFCKAVLRCSPMDSIEYKEALVKNGGKPLAEDYFS